MATVFVVARTWNAHGDRDYLAGWNERWGTVCSGKARAMRFNTRCAAQTALENARRLVPAFTDGRPVPYSIETVRS